MQSANTPGDPLPPTGGNVEPAAGWLTDRPFLVSPNKRRVSGAFGASLIVHLLILLAMVVVMTVPGVSDMLQPEAPDVVYVFMPGPGGGGGGGGNRTPDPPKKAEIEVPKPPVSKPTPIPTPVVPQLPQPVLPPITTQAPITVPGTLSALSTPVSAGSGTGGGAGTGRGTGSGEGTGSGIGPGEGGGTGGGRYRPGSLVTDPTVLSEVKPAYTAEAMRAKIQGEVEIEGVVMPDGRLADLRIVRSLDRAYGLDQKALEAVRQWKFKPGVLKSTGQPVPIIVTIALTFTLR
ncbi:MAG: energy transducer TonB [Vicinamibacterales bacterium]